MRSAPELSASTAVPAPQWGTLAFVIAALLGLAALISAHGARIAFGCNIGAAFSGVASTSVRGWL